MKCIYLFFFLSLLFSSTSIFAVDYYWVGGSGPWSDLSHWANNSGGSGNAYSSVPTSTDAVYFDTNSFSAVSDVVTIDGNYAVLNLDCASALGAMLQGNNSFSLSIHGDLDLGSIDNAFNGTTHLRGVGNHSIICGNSNFASTLYLHDGIYYLNSNLSSAGGLNIQGGRLNFNGYTATLQFLITSSLQASATLDFSDATLNLEGAATPLNLKENGQNLTVISTALSFINLQPSGGSSSTIYVGTQAKTLPHFTASKSNHNFNFRTGTVTNLNDRVRFRDILCTGDFVNLFIDNNTLNCNIKSFDNIRVGNDAYINLKGPNGASIANGTNTIIAQQLITGSRTKIWFQANELEIKGKATFGPLIDFYARKTVSFRDTVHINGTNTGKYFGCRYSTTFDGPVYIDTLTRFNFSAGTNFNQNVTLLKLAEAEFTSSNSTSTLNFKKTLQLGVKARFTVGSTNEIVNFNSDDSLVMLEESMLKLLNTNTDASFGNIKCSKFNVIEFTITNKNILSGNLELGADCNSWNWFRSNKIGSAAEVECASNQNVSHLTCEHLNVTTSTINNTNGVDLVNNLGVVFTTPDTSNSYYWVGGHLQNDSTTKKNNLLGSGNNQNWSNPANWSLFPDSLSSNPCVPTPIDNVHFTAYSFSIANGLSAELDLAGLTGCNNMVWTNVLDTSYMDRDSLQNNRELLIYGNVEMDNPSMINEFESLITFSARDTFERTIDFKGEQAAYNIVFDYPGGKWKIISALDVNGPGANANVTIEQGTVTVLDTQTITVEGDWTVNQTTGLFSSGIGKVVFDGDANNNIDQYIDAFNSPFYNLEVNISSTRRLMLRDSIIVQAHIDILDGHFWDYGSQIIGNGIHQLFIADNTMLTLGNTNKTTRFPTNYIRSNINIEDASLVQYYSTLPQNISPEPAKYGNLKLGNLAGSHLKEKHLYGAIQVNGYMHIDNEQNCIDNGHQIHGNNLNDFILDPGSKLTLGSDATATVFPTLFQITNTKIFNSTEVIYNAGVPQAVRSLNNNYPHSYFNVTFRDANTGTVPSGNILKTLQGAITVRNDLTIEQHNELDANSANYDIKIEGNWINHNVFNGRAARVHFNGIVNQSIEGNAVTDFFTLQFDNAQGITLNQKANVIATADFTNGIVTAATYAHPLRFLANAFVGAAHPADDNSHVNGYVAKVSTATNWFRYPCGDGTYYRPIATLPNSSTLVEFQTKYIPSAYSNRTVLPPLHHVSNLEYWELDRTNGTVPAKVELSWNTASLAYSGTSGGYSHLRVAHFEGNDWEDIGGLNPTWNGSIGFLHSTNYWNTFSPFTLGTILEEALLPVDILTFDAKTDAAKTTLNWSVQKAQPIRHFEVLHSSKGREFSPVLEVEGKHTKSIQQYHALHPNKAQGVHYYRLKIYFENGAQAYSAIRAVEIKKTPIAHIYPVPATEQIILSVSLAEIQGLVIFDNTGQQIESIPMNRGAKAQIDIRQLPPGIYQLQIQLKNKGQFIQKRFVKR